MVPKESHLTSFNWNSLNIQLWVKNTDPSYLNYVYKDKKMQNVKWTQNQVLHRFVAMCDYEQQDKLKTMADC